MSEATATTRPATAGPHTGPTTGRRTGQTITVLVSAFLLFDTVIHVLNIQPVVDGARSLGFDPQLMPLIGILELVCLGLYVVPRTSVLGAIALTGYLGGAFCARLRIQAILFSTLLFPVYVGIAVWAGLCLRDPAVRRLLQPRQH